MQLPLSQLAPKSSGKLVAVDSTSTCKYYRTLLLSNGLVR